MPVSPDPPSDRLAEAIRLAERGRREEARELLHQHLRLSPHDEAAWLWLSRWAEKREERAALLRQVLRINPENRTARRELQALQQRANPGPQTVADPSSDLGLLAAWGAMLTFPTRRTCLLLRRRASVGRGIAGVLLAAFLAAFGGSLAITLVISLGLAAPFRLLGGSAGWRLTLRTGWMPAGLGAAYLPLRWELFGRYLLLGTGIGGIGGTFVLSVYAGTTYLLIRLLSRDTRWLGWISFREHFYLQSLFFAPLLFIVATFFHIVDYGPYGLTMLAEPRLAPIWQVAIRPLLDYGLLLMALAGFYAVALTIWTLYATLSLPPLRTPHRRPTGAA
ncbi:MAG: hypothetical protein D6759_04370 [Chloroflexi bacterium]|nr:MAG: hypothetical protein D6759_04370 [Chloroflexota bacterium]